MKSTGIVRKVDELGRIVLPIELRRTLDIAEKDSLEIYMDGPAIVLKKYQPACIFCDDAKDVIVYHGKNICRRRWPASEPADKITKITYKLAYGVILRSTRDGVSFCTKNARMWNAGVFCMPARQTGMG